MKMTPRRIILAVNGKILLSHRCHLDCHICPIRYECHTKNDNNVYIASIREFEEITGLKVDE